MSETTSDSVPTFELTTLWEGPAQHSPGVLFKIPADGVLPVDVDLTELAGWVAIKTLHGPLGDPLREKSRAQVREVLSTWRRNCGQAKLDELKQRVTEQMLQCQPDGKLTVEEVLRRIDTFFASIPE